MSARILVENVRGSGHGVTLTQDFGDYSVCRSLQPGENIRVEIAGPLSITECPLGGKEPKAPQGPTIKPTAAAAHGHEADSPGGPAEPQVSVALF
jgi:hypothetical protein